MNSASTTITTKHFPQLAYSRFGSGPAIMLLHGFPASGILWKEIIPAFAESFTLFVPDIPGAGASRLVGEAVSMEELATIVPAILDNESIPQCILAGHSMGGYISLAAAKLFPERLLGLSLVHSTAKADDDEKKEKRRKSIEIIRKGGKNVFIRGMVPSLFCDSFKTQRAEVVDEWTREGEKLWPESMIAFYTAMLERPDRTEVVKDAPFPVQWIAGSEDALIPAKSILQQSSLSNVCFISRYRACGHMSMIEHPQKLTEDLRNFAAYCLNSCILEEEPYETS